MTTTTSLINVLNYNRNNIYKNSKYILNKVKIILYLIIFIFIAETLQVNAQIFQFGLKGALNKTEIKDDNIPFSEPPDGLNNYKFSYGGSYGLSAGYFMNKRIGNRYAEFGIVADFLKSNYNQNFTRDKTIQQNLYEFVYKTEIYTLDIPIAFRIKTYRGIYMEMGYQYSEIEDVYQVVGNNTLKTNYTDKNYKNKYIRNSNSVLGGMGINLSGDENLVLNVGFRAIYGVSDLSRPQRQQIENYQSTNMFTYGVSFEIAYRFIKFQDAYNHRLKQFDYHINKIRKH